MNEVKIYLYPFISDFQALWPLPCITFYMLQPDRIPFVHTKTSIFERHRNICQLNIINALISGLLDCCNKTLALPQTQLFETLIKARTIFKIYLSLPWHLNSKFIRYWLRIATRYLCFAWMSHCCRRFIWMYKEICMTPKNASMGCV